MIRNGRAVPTGGAPASHRRRSSGRDHGRSSASTPEGSDRADWTAQASSEKRRTRDEADSGSAGATVGGLAKPGPHASTLDRIVPGRSDPDEDQRASDAVLLAPFGVGAAYAGVAAAAGPGVFATQAGGQPRAIGLLLLGGLLHLAAYSTLQLYLDARRVAEEDAEWTPRPRLLLAGGALPVAVTLAVRVIGADHALGTRLVALLGVAIVAIPLSSIVAGPVYWYQRRCRLYGRS